MTRTVVIFGTPEEIKQKLLRVKDVLNTIEQTGFERFQHDEEWKYHTVEYDECPKCMPHNGAEFRGDDLQYKFPNVQPVATTVSRINNETVHHKSISCRCVGTWENFNECIINRICDAIINA